MTRRSNASQKIQHPVRPNGWGLKDASLGSIATVPIADLRPSAHNARTHTLRQIKQTANSIEEFGFTNPVLLDESNRILAGHGRVEAAKRLGLTQVPAIPITHLNETQKRAYVLADNQLAAKAGWDKDILKLELQNLVELDFDVELTGFEAGEIDIILGDSLAGSADEHTVPAVQAGTEVTKPGDLWRLGDHALLCGDATDPEAYGPLLDGEKARFVITDPPYNVRIDGNVSGLGRVRHREFKMASGEMSAEQFTAFLRAFFMLLVDNSLAGAIHCIFMDWRHIGEMVRAGNSVFSELKNLCVWVKSNAGMGSFYRSRHELVFVWKSGRAPHINNFELGQFGRARTNVWEYDGANSFSTNRAEELTMHPTVKPVQLFADAIKDCSHRALTPAGRKGLEAEIFLYDTLPGGAGFAAQLVDRGQELFRLALSLIQDCPENCDASCYRCMRSFKNKFEHALLDRHVGSELLSYLLSGTLPRFNRKRLDGSTAILFSDLLRQGREGVTYEAGAQFRPSKGPVLAVPILADLNGKRFAIALTGPLTPDIPASDDLRRIVEETDGAGVIVVNELLVRGNLPAATRLVQKQLGLND